MMRESYIAPISHGPDLCWAPLKSPTVKLASSCCLLALMELSKVDYSSSKWSCRYRPEWLLRARFTLVKEVQVQ